MKKDDKKKTKKEETIVVKAKLNDVSIDDQRWLIKNGFCPDPECNPELGKSKNKTIIFDRIDVSNKIYKCTKCNKKWKFNKGLPKLI